jgi:oligopeptide/dipeptide ABC transporter ATP-binding protein
MTERRPLLEVRNLVKTFRLKGGGAVRAVDGISLAVHPGETLSIVGESGCGKSTFARAALRIHEPTSGEVIFDGQDLLALSPRRMRAMRRHMQFVFQDPYASLDTRKTVGNAIMEPLTIHRVGDRKSREARMLQLLETVGLDAEAASRYPHEFSGGQRQRIGIARAVALEPRLVVADEPVSALDVSLQSSILNLLVQLKRDLGLSYIFISHDLAVVKHISDRVAVMYLGLAVESCEADPLFDRPLHPYTQALISAIPRLRPENRKDQIILTGDVPDPAQPPPGCRFHPRCHRAMDICRREPPPELNMGAPGNPHRVSCHLYP